MFVNKEAVGKRILQIRKKYGYSMQKFGCRATHSGLHKRHIIISNFSKKKAQSHLNDTIMPLFLHFISSMPGC